MADDSEVKDGQLGGDAASGPYQVSDRASEFDRDGVVLLAGSRKFLNTINTMEPQGPCAFILPSNWPSNWPLKIDQNRPSFDHSPAPANRVVRAAHAHNPAD